MVKIRQKYIVRNLHQAGQTADTVYQRSEEKCSRLKARMCFIFANTRKKNFSGRNKVHGNPRTQVIAEKYNDAEVGPRSLLMFMVRNKERV